MRNNFIVAIFWLLVAASCIAMAGYFAYKHIENWGWFLFAGIIILAPFSLNDNITINDEDDEDE